MHADRFLKKGFKLSSVLFLTTSWKFGPQMLHGSFHVEADIATSNALAAFSLLMKAVLHTCNTNLHNLLKSACWIWHTYNTIGSPWSSGSCPCWVRSCKWLLRRSLIHLHDLAEHGQGAQGLCCTTADPIFLSLVYSKAYQHSSKQCLLSSLDRSACKSFLHNWRPWLRRL